MKVKELQTKSNTELQKDLAGTRAKLAQLSVDYRTKEVKNVREIRAQKRTVARILTIMSQNDKAAQGEKS
ncbi:50S ribosomal protein L29 [Patescibacteria group bacterium]|jgi:ribosomal protein L29|nr:50S ribosomal protein L29 [Patescibacteria group bacterium]